MISLTPRNREVLEWIQDFCAKNQIFPTYRDIQRGFGFKSVASVQNHIRRLKEAGLVVSDSVKARTLRLVESVVKGIPIEGTIAAGGFVNFFPGEDEKAFIPPDLFSPRSKDLAVLR